MPRTHNAIQAIRDAGTALGEVMEVLSIRYQENDIHVHVHAMRDLEQVPGEVEFCPRECGTYPYMVQKKYNGALFFCLLAEMPESA